MKSVAYGCKVYIMPYIYANQGFKCKWAVGTLATHAESEPLMRIHLYY